MFAHTPQGWYSPPSDPALIINWEDMKKVEGNSNQNANSEEVRALLIVFDADHPRRSPSL